MQTTLAQFNETASTDAFALQNSYLLKVRLDQGAIRAKQGSMVAYQGDVAFEHAGTGGVSKFMKKALTGEGQDLMKVSGTGEVFLADTAQHVHLIKLEGGEQITVNGRNLLAIDADIDWDIQKVSGAQRDDGRGPLQHHAARRRLGGHPLRRQPRPARRRLGADVRRRAGRDHLVAGRHDLDQDGLQAFQDADRAQLRRVGPDGLRRPGLGARAAVGGARRHAARQRRRRGWAICSAAR